MGTKQIQTNRMPLKLNRRGSRLLGIAVIKSAIEAVKKEPDNVEENLRFFKSDLFHFWAGLAYGGNPDYRSDEDIIEDIVSGRLENDLRVENGGRKSKWF